MRPPNSLGGLKITNFTDSCITHSGGDSGKPCIFPWKDTWTHATNLGCATPDGDSGGVWCPTQLNEDGYYVRNSGKWGYCNEYCKKGIKYQLEVWPLFNVYGLWGF